MSNKKIDEPYNLPTLDDFFENMEDVRMYLKNNNLEYKNTQQKLHNILDNNINIQKIFDEADIENGLSKEECKMLSKIIILNNLHKSCYIFCITNSIGDIVSK